VKIMIYDVIVIGTGAGGATVAKELSAVGMNILILEKGKFSSGNAVDHIKTIKLSMGEERIEQNVAQNDTEYDFLKGEKEVMYIEGVGGTTPISLANACYACTSCYSNSATAQFKIHDLELFEELIEASGDLKVNPLPKSFMGPATRQIWTAAESLGYFVEPMPKFIDFSICDNCGLCILGCSKGAKWEANHFISEATDAHATFIPNFEVFRILYDGQRCRGVEGIDFEGRIKIFQSKSVVLSAGALNTPKILRNSKIFRGVGEGFFTDLFITVGGYLKGAGLNHEIPMGIKSEFGPYFLSPHYSNQLLPLITEKGFPAGPEDIMGIMVKIADQTNGTLHADGTLEKPLHKEDLDLLKKGYHKCVDILTEVGVDPSSIVSTPIRGAHPGGTAAIGKVVDRTLETEVKGLYIADASVIPQAPGRPPILTITALAKRVAKTIIQNNFELKN
jgi:choline dehydrogenase-like flavoprotein